MKKVLLLVFLWVSSCFGTEVPNPGQIVELHLLSIQKTSQFYADTIEQRLSYYYHSRFFDESAREQLRVKAVKFSGELAEILKKQQDYKVAIENYEGSDWQKRFGVSGLWDRLDGDVANTTLFKARIDYYLAVCDDNKDKIDKIQSVIDDMTKGAIAQKDDDFEACVRAAFVGLNGGDDTLYSAMLKKYPESEAYFAKLALDKMSYALESMTVAEVQLAAKLAMSDSTCKYDDMILEAAGYEKFHCEELLFLAGGIVARAGDLKALDYFDYVINVDGQLADSAIYDSAIYIWRWFEDGTIDCEEAIARIQKYRSERNSGDYFYIYAHVLKRCGYVADAIEELGKVANDKGSSKRGLAKYYRVIWQHEIDGDDRAFVDSARILTNYVMDIDKEHLSIVAKPILNRVIQLESELLSDRSYLENCMVLADMIQSENDTDSVLLILELALFFDDIDSDMWQDIDEELENVAQKIGPDNVDLLRIRAKCALKKGHFDKAYGLWSQFLKSFQGDKKTERYWVGKYYQLYCLKKSSLKERLNVAHAAEILLGSSDKTPVFWREKLERLKNPVAMDK